jgi:shikimate kinase
VGLIFLTGMPGTGKTTVGAMLARELHWRFIDLDADIERRVGKTIPQIFAEEGETAFREYESSALDEACRLTEAVVALGAGALERDQNLDLVASSGMLVYLRTDMNTLVERCASAFSRPLLVGAETKEDLMTRLQSLLERREQRFLAAPIIVDGTPGQSAQETAEKVLWALSSHAAG